MVICVCVCCQNTHFSTNPQSQQHTFVVLPGPDITLCGCVCWKHQLTDQLIYSFTLHCCSAMLGVSFSCACLEPPLVVHQGQLILYWGTVLDFVQRHCCSAMLGVFLLAVHVWNLSWWWTKASWFCTEAQSLILYQGTVIDFVPRHIHWSCTEAHSLILYRGTFIDFVLRHSHWFCTEAQSLVVCWGTFIHSLVVYWGTFTDFVLRYTH